MDRERDWEGERDRGRLLLARPPPRDAPPPEHMPLYPPHTTEPDWCVPW